MKRRLDFIGLDDKARTTLAAMQPLIERAIGPALTTFYEKLKATTVSGADALWRDLQKAAPHAFAAPVKPPAQTRKSAPRPLRAAPKAVVNGPSVGGGSETWEEF